ncbi:ricin B-like lectin EULS3 [Actinidia eriantha]|uniref:ricin B-like lectin EULS3 n=1 Tax=Actinidia eriantha TaxID=165200 RepID=UPI0025890411|nr:ricin B-like lectin EULS3 [Actinidia eriantha]
MEYPYGHPTTHTHHHNREEQEYPPPSQQPPPPFHGGQTPPPYYTSNEPPPYYGSNQPPPPQVNPYAHSHVSHTSHHVSGGGGPAPISDNYSQPQPPPPPLQSHHFNNYSEDIQPQTTSDYYSSPPSSVVHISHDSSYRHESEPDRHHYRPHMPSFIHQHHHQDARESAAAKTVRVCTKAKTDYSLTIREGKVILAPSDPSDPFQHWIRDEKYSIRVKDEEGFPSFALVNKATGQAVKHSIGATQPVQLTPYNPDVLDESVLWTESKDLGDGYRTVRMVNNIRLNVDAFNGDKNHGGVYDGTTIVLWEWKKGDNQRWKIVPY